MMRLLLSYWVFKDVDLDALLGRFAEVEVFADSGAFSAMTQNAEISLDAYMQWIERYKHHFTVYSNLDVIRDAEATERNQKLMQDAGFTPLPVFHVATDFVYLERLLAEHDYIALGVAGARGQSYMGWIARCFEMSGGKSLFHGFGLTNYKTVLSFPWKSVDSATWTVFSRFAEVPLFDERTGAIVRVHMNNAQSINKHLRLIKQAGLSPSDLFDSRDYDRVKVGYAAARSFLKLGELASARLGRTMELYLAMFPFNAEELADAIDRGY